MFCGISWWYKLFSLTCFPEWEGTYGWLTLTRKTFDIPSTCRVDVGVCCFSVQVLGLGWNKWSLCLMSLPCLFLRLKLSLLFSSYCCIWLHCINMYKWLQLMAADFELYKEWQKKELMDMWRALFLWNCLLTSVKWVNWYLCKSDNPDNPNFILFECKFYQFGFLYCIEFIHQPW